MSEATIEAEVAEVRAEAEAAEGVAVEALDLAEVPVTQTGVQQFAAKTAYLAQVEAERVARL
jgi:hypothetical protein